MKAREVRAACARKALGSERFFDKSVTQCVSWRSRRARAARSSGEGLPPQRFVEKKPPAALTGGRGQTAPLGSRCRRPVPTAAGAEGGLSKRHVFHYNWGERAIGVTGLGSVDLGVETEQEAGSHDEPNYLRLLRDSWPLHRFLFSALGGGLVASEAASGTTEVAYG